MLTATILRLDGLRVVIYPNDHRPEHAHVIGADAEADVDLRCPAGPAVLRESYGFTARRLRRLIGELNETLSTLCDACTRIHDSE